MDDASFLSSLFVYARISMSVCQKDAFKSCDQHVESTSSSRFCTVPFVESDGDDKQSERDRPHVGAIAVIHATAEFFTGEQRV